MVRMMLTGTAVAATLAVATTPALAQGVQLTIGKLLETTGPLSETGPSQDKAVKLAVQYANEQATKAGIAVQAKDIGADVQGDPQAAVSARRKAVWVVGALRFIAASGNDMSRERCERIAVEGGEDLGVQPYIRQPGGLQGRLRRLVHA